MEQQVKKDLEKKDKKKVVEVVVAVVVVVSHPPGVGVKVEEVQILWLE